MSTPFAVFLKKHGQVILTGLNTAVMKLVVAVGCIDQTKRVGLASGHAMRVAVVVSAQVALDGNAGNADVPLLSLIHI